MNRALNAIGGARWQSAEEAIGLIRASIECSEQEAIKALEVLIDDKRVPARRIDTGEIAQGSLGAPPAEFFADQFVGDGDLKRFGYLKYYRFEVRALRDELRQSAGPGPGAAQKRPGGRPQLHDWKGAENHLRQYVEKNGKPLVKARLTESAQEWFVKNDGGRAPDRREIERKVDAWFYGET
jgi:hypothetical protein